MLRVQSWLSLRYSRPAWPSAFVERANPARQRFIEILEPLRDDVEVRVALNPTDKELRADQAYKIAVFFVVDGDVWESEKATRTDVQSAFMGFVTALNSCEGIEVDQERSDAISGDEFTWQETRTTDAWNFANLSYPDPP